MLYPLAFQMPGLTEWIVIGIIGLLLFGKRLPEVGRSLGKGIVEFKKGLKGVEEDINAASEQKEPTALPQPVSQPTSAATPAQPGFKFDPYTGKPLTQNAEAPAAPSNPA